MTNAPCQCELAQLGVDARELEMVQAQRDALATLVDQLEAMVTRIGGYTLPEDQKTIRNARVQLEQLGLRQCTLPREWRNRG